MSDRVEVSIVPATVHDAERVAAVAGALFRQAYGPTHPEPELSRYLARSFAVPRLQAELAQAGTSFFIAMNGAERDIGYAHLRATPDAPDGVRGDQPFEIVRFYVDEGWHGRGVAQALMAACLSAARNAGGDVVWLQAWQQALRPQAFYRRSGFEIVGTASFHFGDRIDDDVVMARGLDP